MHKGIRLTVNLWIEAEDEPAHNFAKYTIQAIRDIISAGNWRHPGLKVTIRKIVEDTDWEESEK
jgi:hypothetical protein